MTDRHGVGYGILAATLSDPASAGVYGIKEWERLIAHARAAELLGQLRFLLDREGVLATAPDQARRHLDTAWRLSQRHFEAVRWELMHIRDALAPLDLSVVVLKGAAYCLAGCAPAAGRVFNDVDILVPRARLNEAEERLIARGWIPELTSHYDQRYYRRWMHELPPMQHKDRATVLDVHHTIVPPVSGIVPDPRKLIADAITVREPGLDMFSVLSAEDMVVHSASHLFFNEFHKGLRDLYDLHALFGEFGADPAFWSRLEARAIDASLARPVLDAMDQCQRVFGTPIPPSVREALQARIGPARLAPVRRWMLERLFYPAHPDCEPADVLIARWMAFVRSHWLKMPLPLLVYHLAYKALNRSGGR